MCRDLTFRWRSFAYGTSAVDSRDFGDLNATVIKSLSPIYRTALVIVRAIQCYLWLGLYQLEFRSLRLIILRRTLWKRGVSPFRFDMRTIGFEANCFFTRLLSIIVQYTRLGKKKNNSCDRMQGIFFLYACHLFPFYMLNVKISLHIEREN